MSTKKSWKKRIDFAGAIHRNYQNVTGLRPTTYLQTLAGVVLRLH